MRKYTLDYRRFKDGTKVRSCNRFSLGWTGVILSLAFDQRLDRPSNDRYVVEFNRNELGHPMKRRQVTVEGKYLEVL